MATMLKLPSPAKLGASSMPPLSMRYESTLQFCVFHPAIAATRRRGLNQKTRFRFPLISCCSDTIVSTTSSSEATEKTTPPLTTAPAGSSPPPIRKRRRRYRKQYPGEMKGITEEMRFVAMRLRSTNKVGRDSENDNSDREIDGIDNSDSESDDVDVDFSNSEQSISSSSLDVAHSGGDGGGRETWQPSMEGFVKYLVDSKLVFNTVERIVDESSDVSYAYFRKTGLERSESLSKDLEWFSQQDVLIPEPSNPGVTYVDYLKELAENNPPLFLCHFYNIYFSHIAGGQVIAKQVSKRLLDGRELELYSWEGDAGELLKGVREKLNMIGQHWSREQKNKCLREATKSFRYLGQIVRQIIL